MICGADGCMVFPSLHVIFRYTAQRHALWGQANNKARRAPLLAMAAGQLLEAGAHQLGTLLQLGVILGIR